MVQVQHELRIMSWFTASCELLRDKLVALGKILHGIGLNLSDIYIYIYIYGPNKSFQIFPAAVRTASGQYRYIYAVQLYVDIAFKGLRVLRYMTACGSTAT